MLVEVVLLPRDLRQEHLHDRTVVVFDVLRATTSMIAALAAGAREIRIFDSLDAARTAARGVADGKLLCGEQRCLRPEDFDLGNSPGDFTSARVQGRTLLMSTTNGTRAIVAARDGELILVASLINAWATAEAVIDAGLDCTLLCAGTEGQISLEDVIGAGAMINSAMLIGNVRTANDEAEIARHADLAARDGYIAAMRRGAGGRNVVAAGLERDVEFAAQLDSVPVVGQVRIHDTGQISVFRQTPAV
jgi:2-phosphosulfolactate phosphatase